MIAAYQGTSLLSWMIRIRTWSKYSHVSWIMLDQSEIEAWQTGGVAHNAKWGILHTPGTVVDFYEFKNPLTATERTNIETFLLKQVGKKYDKWGVLRFLPVFRLFMRKANDISEWFCSELVMEGCEQGPRPLLNKEPQRTTPDDVPTSTELRFVEQRTVVPVTPQTPQ